MANPVADPDIPLGSRTDRGSGRGMNRLDRLRAAGVSIWLDTLSRELLDSGAIATLIAD